MGLPAKYFRVWRRMAIMSLKVQMSTKIASAGFLTAKIIRLGFFLLFIVAIFRYTKSLAGYTLEQTVLFFLTYNLVDISAQMLFRGMYSARNLVAQGDIDFYLVQPLHPLFRLACYTVDFLDMFSLLPVLAMVLIATSRLPGPTGAGRILAYSALVSNGVLIALSFHIVVAGLAVRTQELDNTIWVYRDLMSLGRFPADIYAARLRWVLTLVVPIAVMVTFPTKALFGLLSPGWMLFAFLMSGAALAASMAFWRDSLAKYTSVSS